MANTQVNVEVLVTKREFFCNIIFTVLQEVGRLPVQGFLIKLTTLTNELVPVMPKSDINGKVTYLDMPSKQTYNWFATHPDYNDKRGEVTTI